MLSKCYASIAFLLLLSGVVIAQKKTAVQKADSVLKLMTLDEKVGQLNQYNGDWEATGPITKDGDKQAQIRNGQLGSMLNIRGVAHTRQLQEMAMQSRLKIPLLFGQDVIHGYFINFPIPLAEAASWDLPAIEKSARIAGIEAAAGGIHWTFAPMVDISRDARWGRVMEGAGEDPYLGSLIAAARVKGFQGKGLGNTDAVMACVKHYAAYGAPIAGKDYGAVDMSEQTLWETYLPTYKAAVEAGAATVMNSFNSLNGVPASANSMLLRTILKGKWKFKGFVVSDWGSIGEMINHGYVKDNYEAARAALIAGSDMDMESRSYKDHLAKLVNKKEVPIGLVNDAVKRILTKKFEMGLFDDPYRFCSEEREKKEWNNPAHRIASRQMAEKSIVLLKNEGQLLPLSMQGKKIALVGPLGQTQKDMLGFWSTEWGDKDSIISVYMGLRQKLGAGASLKYARGCGITDTITDGFYEAVQLAKESDVVIMALGEQRDMTGEAKSKANIHLPGVQEKLVKAVMATGKPVVVLLMAGRPMIFNWTADHAPAILYTWWLGTEAGNAIANVLAGDYNPAGKLPMSFPRSLGQIPIFYNYTSTGRPSTSDSDYFYKSAYIDEVPSPRYAFGYGLSYTSFTYGNLKLSKNQMRANETLDISVDITNTGKFKGEEVVQLYLKDQVASIVQPVKKLKDFKKIMLQPGETQTVHFLISKEKLSFYNQQLQWVAEPGDFDVMIGSSSADIRQKASITLVK